MKTDMRIRYHTASYVELPAPVSVKNESGARKWIGGAFNKRKTVKGGINGIKSSSAQPFNINGNVLVTNSGIWNYIQKASNGKTPSEQEGYNQAFLQKIPMLDITHTSNNTKEQKPSDKTENDNNKEKTFSHKDDAMRDVLQSKIFKLQFESEVSQYKVVIYYSNVKCDLNHIILKICRYFLLLNR
jgi:hypothetical protein